ncbi:MAG: FHA domain-containing protein, partial [Faecousia sp.]
PAWGQQANPTPNQSAQVNQAPAWGQQANPTPNQSVQVNQAPAWGQQANPTPNQSAQVNQAPNRNAQEVQLPAWGQQKRTPSQWNQSADQAEAWMKKRDWSSAQAAAQQDGALRQSQPSERYGVITLLGVPGHPSKRLYSGQSVSIGRSPERCELVDSGDTYISKEHCRITFNLENGCFYVTDLSANGTFSDAGAQLRRQEATKLPLNTTIYLATEKHKVSLSVSG